MHRRTGRLMDSTHPGSDPPSTLSKNFWSSWRCQPYRPKAARSSWHRTTGYPRGSRYRFCINNVAEAIGLELDSLQQTFSRKAIWAKGYTVWHTVTNHSFYCEMLVFFNLHFLILIFVLFSFVGEVARAEGVYRWTESWVRLVCMIDNSKDSIKS